MEPLKPRVREALKEAHTGLTDATIDRLEELLAERFQIDPEVEPLRIQELDRQRAELIRSEMPMLNQVLQKMSGEEQESREEN